MIYRGLVCLLLGAMSWGQAANSGSSAAPQNPASSDSAPASAAPAAKAPDASTVAPDAAVITIQGLCDNPPADAAAAPDCKTIITRAEFESLISVVAPRMPPAARKQIATRYATALVMAHKAHELGLDQGTRWEERMKIARMQALAQELGESFQEKAGQVPDKDIDDYYQKNVATYEEASLSRLFIPKSKTLPPSKVKLSAAENTKRQKDAEAAMKTEADALRARAAKGEDFGKLQQEAFVFAGLKSKPPSVNMLKDRRSSLPPNHVSIMDLKSGAVSAVIVDQSGYFVYKIGEKDTIPEDQVREEIKATLKNQKLQESMQAVQHAATPKLDDTYFAVPAGAQPQGMPQLPPGVNPPPKANTPEPK